MKCFNCSSFDDAFTECTAHPNRRFIADLPLPEWCPMGYTISKEELEKSLQERRENKYYED